ncbi:MAG: amidohydrolase family protein [Caldisericia bacterium]|nr:amidohydrolase family protein [Caldisericia bacterium]
MLFVGSTVYNPKIRVYKNQDIRTTNGVISDIQDHGILSPFSNEIVTDITSKFVYPGFIDSHCHLMATGEKYITPSLELTKSKEQLYHVIKSQLELQNTIVLRGWSEETLGFTPDKNILDSFGFKQPILLIRKCGHIGTVNSQAIQVFELEKYHKVDQTDITIGMIKEKVLLIARRSVEQNTEYENLCIQEGAKRYTKFGVTTVNSEDWTPNRLESFLKAYPNFSLPLRLYEKISIDKLSQIKQWSNIKNNLQKNFNSSGFLFNKTIKLYMDGSIGGKTASMSVPYLNSNNYGVSYYSSQEINKLFIEANKYNLQICIHIIGDRGLQEILYGISNVELQKNRHRLIHVQFASAEQINIMKQNRLRLSIQPPFYRSDLKTAKTLFDTAFLKSVGYQYREMYASDISFSLSTDSPIEPESPFSTLYYSEEFMPRAEAFESYTAKGAEHLFQETSLGIIEKGFFADFFTLNKDLFLIPRNEILDTIPEQVYLGGKPI